MKLALHLAAALLAAIGAMAHSVHARQPAASEPLKPQGVMGTGFKVDQVLSRIAFGSCAQQARPQPIWHAIADLKPDLFIFTGDNVYADTKDMAKLRADYAKLNAMPGFARLREQGCPILATWDDHDFGKNDAGAEWEAKRESQQVFLDWLGVPADSPLRQREGVYSSIIVGPAGRRVQVILLDTRTFRSPVPDRGPEPSRALGHPGMFLPNTDTSSTILGPDQWAWLGEQLRLDADLRIIVSSIQFVADEHHFEMWANFPHERERMITLINSAHASGVIFISGDRHHAEISRLDPTSSGGSPVYPLWDVTSSALNQTKRWGNEINPHRIGTMYNDENFGLIEINWAAADPLISLQIRDIAGTPLMIQEVALSALRAK
jgi:alkaline phosphatase D